MDRADFRWSFRQDLPVDDEDDDDPQDAEYMNCPVHVYLDSPLSGRAVIAIDEEHPLPLFVPNW